MIRSRHRRLGCNRPLAARRGIAMAVVMVTLGILVLLAGGLVVAARDRHAQAQGRDRQAQAAWLADSGLARAAARLRLVADYAGETWKIEAEQLGGRDAASVTIRVEPVADAPARRRVLVTAEFPAGGERPVRRSREIVVELPTN